MSTSETMKITNNNNNQSNPQPFMSLESRIKMFERTKSTQINLNSQIINKPQIVPPQNSIKFQNEKKNIQDNLKQNEKVIISSKETYDIKSQSKVLENAPFFKSRSSTISVSNIHQNSNDNNKPEAKKDTVNTPEIKISTNVSNTKKIFETKFNSNPSKPVVSNIPKKIEPPQMLTRANAIIEKKEIPLHKIENPISNNIEKKEILSDNNLNDKKFLSFLPQVQIKEIVENNSFCEGFFISSFSTDKGNVIENSEDFLSTCGHEKCSELPAMQPEVIYKYPPKDTQSININNLAASICFPSGIKICYGEETNIPIIPNYGSIMTNQKGDRFYLMTYHFYYRLLSSQLTNKYQMYPIKYQTMKLCTDFYDKIAKDNKIEKKITKKLGDYEKLLNSEIVHIPFCLCLISRYPYFSQMGKCLESIKEVISSYKMKSQELNDLIVHIVKEIPIPPLNQEVQFTLPFLNNFISLKNVLLSDFCYLDQNLIPLLNLFSVENVISIFRLILFEKKIIFVDNEYCRLGGVINGFIGLLYPFQ